MNTIHFTKMQGCGNDFIIADYSEYKKTRMFMPEMARRFCDRHFGIGADGLIIPDYKAADADIGWYFYNSDGSAAQMCGNGMRCFARYLYDKKILDKTEFTVKTGAGIISPKVLPTGDVRVKMPIPILDTARIPFNGEYNLNFPINLNGCNFYGSAVSMGNPHFIIFTDQNTGELAKKYGPQIEVHPLFPEKTNVEFVKILSPDKIELSVWERGCGITLACGTGACAAVAAGVLNNLIQNKTEVMLPGGVLKIEWQGTADNLNYNMFLTGAAEYVFEGEFVL